MKRRKRIVLLLAVCLLSLSACLPKQMENGSSHTEASGTVVSVPEEFEEFRDNPDTKFILNMRIEIPGEKIESVEKGGKSIGEFNYNGGEIKANVIMTNGLQGSTSVGLLVLCDGIPVEYTDLETEKKAFHHTYDLEEQKIIQIRFTPDFSAGIGRVDFVQLAFPEQGALLTHCSPLCLYANLPENYSSANGDAAKKTDDYITDIRKAMDLQRGAMDAEMLLYGTKVNEDTGTPGEIELDIGGKSQIPIELVVGEQGAYRAAFFLDCEPFAVFDEKSVLDFEVQENQMLSFELPLKELIPAGTHTLFALVTRMDEKVYSYARTLPTSKWKIKN